MYNGMEPTVVDESEKRLEDEVRRVVEQSIRQRAASLDSILRRLLSSIDARYRQKFLHPELSDKAHYISFVLSFLIISDRITP